MKLFVIKDGIEINYNKNEKFIETVFGLDDNNKLIQKAIFPTEIYFDNIKFYKFIDNALEHNNIEQIDHGFLLYSFAYQISYGHFMTQTIPKLYDYLNNYKNFKLLIPENHYNNLYKDIINILNIDNNNVYILKSYTIYNILNYTTGKFYEVLSNINEYNWIYTQLRNGLMIKKPEYRRYVYLKKDGMANNNYNNNETGIIRKILNEDELIDKLKTYNFEIITLGDKLLKEKAKLLEDIDILITQNGANCMNFIFSNGPKNIIILSNNTPIGVDFYLNYCEILNNTKINHLLLTYPSDPKYNDITNRWNNAFTVNIQQIENIINSLKKNKN
jgi:capsular polysaccharide biosynthesis protein